MRAVVGTGCVRGAQLRGELKRGRDRSLPAGVAPLDADVVALLCAHACADPPADRKALDGGTHESVARVAARRPRRNG